MINLIKNELIKILKRKNIYILLVIGILIITIYNFYQKLENSNINISNQYQRAYDNDKFILENFDELSEFNDKDNYEDIIERIKLEEYAIENNIQYNILLNSENSSAPLSKDARILLMKLFNNFEIIIIFIIIYLSSTIISEEYSTGTIKYLLIKPYTRTQILLSKLLTNLFVISIIIIFIILLQYLLGGLLFGFDSYNLEAIRYNTFTQEIETISLINYMILLVLSKMPVYLLLTLISLLFGIITNNIALNILISLSMYIISNLEILINNISKYIFIYNWDISKYIFSSNRLINQSILISIITLLIITTLLFSVFKNKDIKNE